MGKIDLKLLDVSGISGEISRLKEKIQRPLDLLGYEIGVKLEAGIGDKGELAITASPDCEDADIFIPETRTFPFKQGWSYR